MKNEAQHVPSHSGTLRKEPRLDIEIGRLAARQEVNAWMTLEDGSAIKVDFLWRDQRLAVETDGHPFHRTRQSRERDTKRDQLLRLAGFEPVRFTGRQVALEKEWVTRTMLALASRPDGVFSRRARPQAA